MVFILDLMKSGKNGNDNIIQKMNFNKKIIKSFIIKNKLVIIFTDAEIKTYKLNIKEENEEEINNEKDEKNENLKEEEDLKIVNENKELKLNLEKPDKKNENDLEIRVRYVSISKIDKIKIITISYSNNEVYFYDLNKILKYEELENKKDDNNNKSINLIKKYGKIEYNIPGKITTVDSELIRQ